VKEISKAKKNETKIEARVNIKHLEHIRQAVGAPLVLQGGTGIHEDYIMESIRHGIVKMNITTAISQPY